MKKIITFACCFLPAVCFAGPSSHYIFNYSEKYDMEVIYTNGGSDPQTVSIPNAKNGKNYIKTDANVLNVVKVTEKNPDGTVHLKADFYNNSILCDTGFDSTTNTIILDDMRGSDVMTCSLSESGTTK